MAYCLAVLSVAGSYLCLLLPFHISGACLPAVPPMTREGFSFHFLFQCQGVKSTSISTLDASVQPCGLILSPVKHAIVCFLSWGTLLLTACVFEEQRTT